MLKADVYTSAFSLRKLSLKYLLIVPGNKATTSYPTSHLAMSESHPPLAGISPSMSVILNACIAPSMSKIR